MRKKMMYWCLLMLAMSLRTPSVLARTWGLSVVDVGVGPGIDYKESAPGQHESSIGGVFSADICTASLGFESLNGFGVRTKLYEITGIVPSDRPAIIASVLPVYAYYPIYSKEKELDHYIFDDFDTVRSPFVYLFAGGSAWGHARRSAWGQRDNYAHIGISAIFGAYSWGEVPTGPDPDSDFWDLFEGDSDFWNLFEEYSEAARGCCLLGCVMPTMLAAGIANAIPIGYFGIQGGVLYSFDRTASEQHGIRGRHDDSIRVYISLRLLFAGFYR